jgi:hypothetical protein
MERRLFKEQLGSSVEKAAKSNRVTKQVENQVSVRISKMEAADGEERTMGSIYAYIKALEHDLIKPKSNPGSTQGETSPSRTRQVGASYRGGIKSSGVIGRVRALRSNRELEDKGKKTASIDGEELARIVLTELHVEMKTRHQAVADDLMKWRKDIVQGWARTDREIGARKGLTNFSSLNIDD